MTRSRAWSMALAIVTAGCGGSSATPATGSGDPPTTTRPAATPAVADAGTITFTVGGERRTHRVATGGDVYYSPLASHIRARPSSGGGSLTITFMAIDLKALEYPADLPPARGAAVSPLAAMVTVGFSYIDAAGAEWAGPGRVHIQSFGGDGVIRGSFTEVTLPHTDQTEPDVVLTSGAFRVQMTPAP